MTAKQKQIYDFVIKFTEQSGFPPSVREICAAVNLKSPSTVHTHLKTLKRLGVLSVVPGKTRAITYDRSRREGVPVIGTVRAGQPILAFEEDVGVLPYNAGEGHFALEVRGDSMRDAGILEGDYVVARAQEYAESGEIVVACLLDEDTGDAVATVKRLRRRDGHIWLLPENDAYEPINGDECRIIGKVTAVVRQL